MREWRRKEGPNRNYERVGWLSQTTKHEILAGAAIKKFLELLDDAPRCQCGSGCETRMFLIRQLKSKDARANQLFADLFDEVL